jgi:transcriptional regulator with XRE-family HTH domain
MLSETLATGLQHYRIGPKIRALRLRKKLGLAQLGDHTGLSPAMLSKIERGQLFPTLPTLLRIAMVFGVGLDHFFIETGDRPLVAVIRKQDRLRLPDTPHGTVPSYLFESLDFPVSGKPMAAYLAEFPATGGPTAPHRHDGVELVYVIRGRLSITLAEQEYPLADGDAMYFDSGTPHCYRRGGDAACQAIVVTVPVPA